MLRWIILALTFQSSLLSGVKQLIAIEGIPYSANSETSKNGEHKSLGTGKSVHDCLVSLAAGKP